MAKILTGTVVSLKMQDTAVVSVEKYRAHPIYKKRVRRTKRYKAHVEEGMKLTLGESVTIEETRPLSRDKHFKIIRKG